MAADRRRLPHPLERDPPGCARRSHLDRGQGERRPPRPAGHRPRHRGRRHGAAAPLGARHRGGRRDRRHLHRDPPLPRLPRGPLDRGRPARAALRPLPAPPLRLPRPHADRAAHEPGQHGPQPDPGLPRDDPADDLERGHRPRRRRDPLDDRPGPHPPGAGEPAVPQRAVDAVLPAPAPLGARHPAGVRRARRRGRGDRGRGSCGQGLRRRGRAGRAAAGRGRRRLRAVDGGGPRAGRLPAGPRRCCPTSA